MAVCVSANPAGQYLIARGARMARRMDAELYVIHVDREIGFKESNQVALSANLRFAENLGAKVVRLRGKSVADSVAEFVRSKHITQVIFGRAALHDWRKYLYLSAVHRFLRESPAVDVHIVTQNQKNRTAWCSGVRDGYNMARRALQFPGGVQHCCAPNAQAHRLMAHSFNKPN